MRDDHPTHGPEADPVQAGDLVAAGRTGVEQKERVGVGGEAQEPLGCLRLVLLLLLPLPLSPEEIQCCACHSQDDEDAEQDSEKKLVQKFSVYIFTL